MSTARSPQEGGPELSILVFTRNDAQHLSACLAQLEATPPSLGFEVIVFENASEDDSLEVLERFSTRLPLRWTAAAVETSFSAGNNAVLQDARGELVLFLNPDTLPTGPVLDGCARILQEDASAGLVSPRLVYPDGAHQPTGWWLPSPGRLVKEHGLGLERELPPDPAGRTDVGWLMGCFLMGRREQLLGLGGFDEDFWFHATDLELCARVGASGSRVVRAEDLEMVHVGHRSWDRERREACQGALARWLRRDHGALAARGVAAAARVREALR